MSEFDGQIEGLVAHLLDCADLLEKCESQDIELAELREKAAVLDRLEAVLKGTNYDVSWYNSAFRFSGANGEGFHSGSTIAEALADFEARNGGAA